MPSVLSTQSLHEASLSSFVTGNNWNPQLTYLRYL